MSVITFLIGSIRNFKNKLNVKEFINPPDVYEPSKKGKFADIL